MATQSQVPISFNRTDEGVHLFTKTILKASCCNHSEFIHVSDDCSVSVNVVGSHLEFLEVNRAGDTRVIKDFAVFEQIRHAKPIAHSKVGYDRVHCS